MNRLSPVTLGLASALTALAVSFATPANAQVDIQIGTAPPPVAVPLNGPYGDRDRDGIPNAYDRHDNRRANSGAWGDRDHDGIPNRYDRHDNRALRDSDHDGVPNAWDRNAHNPYVR